MYTTRLYLEDEVGHKLLVARWNADFECWDVTEAVNCRDVEDFLNNAAASADWMHPDEGNLNVDLNYELRAKDDVP